MNFPRRRFLALPGLLALGGCGSLLPTGGPPPDLYSLWPKYRFSPDLPDVKWQLVIEEPFATGAFDTNRIAVRSTEFEIRYYAGARWTDRAPKMVQSLLIESFENTGKIVSVGRQSVGLRSDFNLKSELREFELDLFRDPKSPSVRVRLNLKLIRQPREQIIASDSFQHIEHLPDSQIANVVDGFNEAINKVLKQVVEWTLRAGAASLQQSS